MSYLIPCEVVELLLHRQHPIRILKCFLYPVWLNRENKRVMFEEEKNKAVIQNLAEKIEDYEADLKKKDFTIQDLEMMVKEHEGALEKKDFVIQTMEGSLAEVQTENNSLKNEVLQQSEKFEQEKKYLESRLKTEVDKNSIFQKSFKELQEKCLGFGS
jgi:chromosome segregation ATPase